MNMFFVVPKEKKKAIVLAAHLIEKVKSMRYSKGKRKINVVERLISPSTYQGFKA